MPAAPRCAIAANRRPWRSGRAERRAGVAGARETLAQRAAAPMPGRRKVQLLRNRAVGRRLLPRRGAP
ncbi:hypothetical protein CFB44_15800 [Burkholderia sp. AU31280]|nr:hypothetical protein AS149_35410 [Burkholderia cenocepacia]OXI74704.1 hypothetical protein CFB44_15800 [Burkholderia sp. AU31280]